MTRPPKQLTFHLFEETEEQAVRKLFLDVFSRSEGPAEGRLVSRLVTDLVSSTPKEDLLGVVAEEQDQIVGCVFFSRLVFDAAIDAFILSPLAVRTSHQGRGIGQQLIRQGIGRLMKAGVELLFTYGDPDYYSRAGFLRLSQECIRSPLTLSQPEGWLVQSLAGHEILPTPGRPRCVEALNNPDYW